MDHINMCYTVIWFVYSIWESPHRVETISGGPNTEIIWSVFSQ